MFLFIIKRLYIYFNLFLFCINAFLVFVFVNKTKDDKTKSQKYRLTDHPKFIPYLIKTKKAVKPSSLTAFLLFLSI